MSKLDWIIAKGYMYIINVSVIHSIKYPYAKGPGFKMSFLKESELEYLGSRAG